MSPRGSQGLFLGLVGGDGIASSLRSPQWLFWGLVGELVSQVRCAHRNGPRGSQGLFWGLVGGDGIASSLRSPQWGARVEEVATPFNALLLYGILPAPCTSVQTHRVPPCERRRIRQFLTEAHRGATLRARRFTELLCYRSNTSIIVNPSVPPPCKHSVSLRVRGVIYGSLRRR